MGKRKIMIIVWKNKGLLMTQKMKIELNEK